MSCSRSIACTAVVGSWKGESASERSAMSTRSRTPYATSSSSVGSKLRIRASCNRSSSTSSGLPAHAEKGAARRNELAEGRDELQQAVRTSSFLDKLLVADPRDHPGLPRSDDGKRVQLRVESRPLVRISPVEKRARLVANEFDERGNSECLADVVHVDDEDRDAQENENKRRYERDAWHVAGAVAVDGHLAEREDGVDEGRDEETDRELARLVPQNALHDARRKLTHGELDDDHRDRENERGQAHHRGGDRRKDVSRGVRTADEPVRKRLVVEVAVDSDRRRTREPPR